MIYVGVDVVRVKSGGFFFYVTVFLYGLRMSAEIVSEGKMTFKLGGRFGADIQVMFF